MSDPRLAVLTTREEARRLVEEHQRASKQAKEGAWKRFLQNLVSNARKHHETRQRAPMA